VTRSEIVNRKGQIVDGTCKWTKSNDRFQSWLRSEPGFLWISAGPGKGKTMLSVYITQEMEKKFVASGQAKLIYFFCDNQDQRRNSAKCILRGLQYHIIHQQPQMASHISRRFESSNQAHYTNTSFEALWQIFEGIIQDPRLEKLYCVIDGLDECDENSVDAFLVKLRKVLGSSESISQTSRLKVLITSREYPDCIRLRLTGIPQLRLDENGTSNVAQDIDYFIEERIDEVASERQYSEDLRQSVFTAIKDRADGTFLWAALVLGELKKKKRFEVEETLKALPKGLPNIYGRMLLQIEKDRRPLAALILRWATGAHETMHFHNLGDLISQKGLCPSGSRAVTISDEDLREQIEICGHLLSWHNDHVQLSHQSVAEYLLRPDIDTDPDLELFRFNPSELHTEIANTCFATLQDPTLNINSGGNDRNHSLYAYAALYWHEHARLSADTDAAYLDLSAPIYNDKAILEAFTEYWDHLFPREGFSALHTASAFGLDKLAAKILAQDISCNLVADAVNTQDGLCLTPLWYAAGGGHIAIVKLLLAKGADVDLGPDSKATPLHNCTTEDVAATLIEAGTNIDAQTIYLGRTSLHDAWTCS